jgi:hypothetical protein
MSLDKSELTLQDFIPDDMTIVWRPLLETWAEVLLIHHPNDVVTLTIVDQMQKMAKAEPIKNESRQNQSR